MQVIDIYQLAIEAKCKAMELENLKLKYLQNNSSILENVIDKLKENTKELLKNSPLSTMAEEWINDQIRDVSTDFINKVTSDIEGSVGRKMSNFRNSCFKVITSSMCLQQNLLYFFAMQSANKIVKQCDENIKELKKIKSEVLKLHNMLNTLNGIDDDYISNYFDSLREALKNLKEASSYIKLLKSGYVSSEYFNLENFNRSKKLIDNAADLILKKNKINSEKNNLLDNVNNKIQNGTSKDIANLMGLSSQYSAVQSLWQVPKHTIAIFVSLKKHISNVTRLNFLLTSFCNISGPDSNLFNWYKSSIIEILNQSINLIDSLCKDMSINLNGTTDFNDSKITKYSPNSSQVMLKIPEWGTRIYFLKSILNSLDYESLKKQNEIGKLKSIYEKYRKNIQKINTMRKGQAILISEEAKEIVGDLETDILILCGKVTASLFEKSISGSDGLSSQLKTKKILDRIDLSIELSEEIKKNMAAYAAETKKELGSINDLGDSIINLCNSAGLDRLKDILESGEISTFLKMNESVATYAGAAIAALNTLSGLSTDRFSLNIIEKLKQEVMVELRSKELIEKTSFQNSALTQISKNEIKIDSLKENLETIKKTSGNEGFSDLLGIAGPSSDSINTSIFTPFSKSFGF